MNGNSLAKLLKKPSALFILGAVAIAVASVTVRVIAIQRNWLWYDEYYSAVFATAPDFSKALAAILKFDFHPPLYYLQLRGWASVSTNQTWLLMNSLVWSLIAIVGVYFAGAKVAGRAGGLCSAVLLALLSFAVKEATELRMYSMLIGLSAWGTYAAIEQLTSKTPVRWGVLAFITALSLGWSHGAGVLWFVTWAGIALGMVLLRVDTHAGLRSFFPTVAVAAVGVLPCVLSAAKRQPDHLEASDSANWPEILGALVPGVSMNPVLVSLGLCALVLTVLVLDPRPRALLLVLVLGLIATLGSLWFLGREMPLVHVRTLAFTTPVFAILIGSSIGRALSSKHLVLRSLGAGFLLFLAGQESVSLSDLLASPERSSANHLMTSSVESAKPDTLPVWAPRIGTAYSLCWELGGPKSVKEPSGPSVCRTQSDRVIFSGNRRPPALRAPYLLVLRNKERVPRLAGREQLGQWRKVAGHRVTTVVPRVTTVVPR